MIKCFKVTALRYFVFRERHILVWEPGEMGRAWREEEEGGGEARREGLTRDTWSTEED